ncbi:MAG: tetratricopeptide repeat protein, partial [bacterium]|nr:tetratricopeptide repeat protein [bacterium]
MKKYIILFIIFYPITLLSQQSLEELVSFAIQSYNEGNLELAIEYFNKAILIYEEEYGKEDAEDYAYLKNILGFLYHTNGNYDKAEPLYKEALEMRRRLFKGDHPDLAT